jgi:hypothetical protein
VTRGALRPEHRERKVTLRLVQVQVQFQLRRELLSIGLSVHWRGTPAVGLAPVGPVGSVSGLFWE